VNNVNIIHLAKNIQPYVENLSYGGELKYIKYGKNNDWDKYLIELSKKSPIHGGILNLKKKMDVGGGLKWNYDNKKLDDFYKKLDRNLNNQIFESLELFGGAFIGVKWYKKEIVGLDYIPFSYCKLGEPNFEDKIEYVLVSKNWKKERDERYKPIPFPIFTGEKQDDYEICLIGNKSEGQYYPRASYEAAINYIECDFEISKFHLSNIKQNFFPGMSIVFLGPTTPQQIESTLRDLENSRGSEGSGNFLTFFADNYDEAPVIKPIPTTDLDKQFIVLNDIIGSKIIVSHEIPRILANVGTPGSLGDGNEMISSKYNFYNDYIKYQQNLLRDFYYQVNVINGVDEEVEFIYNKELNYDMILKFKEYLTQDEVREFLGLQNNLQNNVQ